MRRHGAGVHEARQIMSRRERRRARARLRDLYVHGTADRPRAPSGPAPAPMAFAIMRPRPAHEAHATAPRRQLVILQRIDAGRPYRKRIVRYTTVHQWRGFRLAPKP